jgi:protein-L-isoaspartate(D-aspartate) O-methyltransferase
MEAMGVQVVRFDEGDLAHPPAGEGYDVVICEGAVGRAPPGWQAALARDGRLGVVERDGPVGKACLYLRTEDGLGRRELFDATPPVLAGFESQHGFAL